MKMKAPKIESQMVSNNYQRSSIKFYVLRFILVMLVSLLAAAKTAPVTLAQENTPRQVDDLDTNLARAAAQSFLMTLTRPALANTMNFYLTEDIKNSGILSGLLNPPVTGFEVTDTGWISPQTYQVQATLQPDKRQVSVYTGQYDGRWQVEGIDLLLASESSAQPVVSASAGKSTAVQPVNSNGTGQVVFQTQSGAGIYVINADGTGLKYLTTGIDPQLSPDGTQVAFTRWEPDYELFTINIDGTGERSLSKGWRQMKSPTWSADGTRLVFSWQNGGRLDEEERRIDLAKAAQNEDGVHIPGNAREVERDGSVIEFKVPADAQWSLKELNLNTNQLSDPATGPYNYGPSGHPTNPNLFIFRSREGVGLYETQSNSARALTTDFRDRAAVISPDGSKIALSYWQNDHWEIHTLNIDGSSRQRLTETPLTVLAEKTIPNVQMVDGKERIVPRENPHWNNAGPAWSPDGQQIAFMTDRTGKWEIWIMNVDGSNQRPMFPNGVLDELTFNYAGVDERMLSWR